MGKQRLEGGKGEEGRGKRRRRKRMNKRRRRRRKRRRRMGGGADGWTNIQTEQNVNLADLLSIALHPSI